MVQLKGFISLFLLFTFTSSLSFAELGFYESLSRDESVQSKRDSIYKIYLPSPPLYKIAPEQLSEMDLNDIKLPKEIDTNNAEQMTILLFKRQMQSCLKTPEKECLFYTSSIQGSVFFSGDSKTVYTAYHNVEGVVQGQFQKFVPQEQQVQIYQQLAMQSQIAGDVKEVDPQDVSILMDFYNYSRTISTPIIIVNSNNEIVYGEGSDDNYESMDYMPEQIYSFYDVDIQKGHNDFARIKLNKPIGKVLSVAKEEVYQEPRFFMGFPKEQDRSSAEKPSSLGDRMYFSKGRALNTFDLKERTGSDIVTSEEEDKNTLKRIGYCDCDGVSGFSGGAAINEKGEVSFIISQVLPINFAEATEENIISFGPRMTHVLDQFKKLDTTVNK